MIRAALCSAALVALAAALSACDASTSTRAKAVSSAPGEEETMASFDWDTGSCAEAARLDGLDDLDPEALRARLGAPDRQESFRMAERPHEFHAALRNTHPLPDDADVEIREWTWSHDPCQLTVWLHRVGDAWRSFENLRWHRDAEF